MDAPNFKLECMRHGENEEIHNLTTTRFDRIEKAYQGEKRQRITDYFVPPKKQRDAPPHKNILKYLLFLVLLFLSLSFVSFFFVGATTEIGRPLVFIVPKKDSPTRKSRGILCGTDPG
mmetsp:Transcript_30078/g.69381  ORF Transcript_30078/g.69381 Transcript_30078/m.69381 type:complete len:118 (+) Transcript_30078:1778-2131(+)